MRLKNEAFHKKVIRDVFAELDRQKIDLYLILTSEGADSITSFLPGVDTVGAGAFLFTKEGHAYAFSSSIDSGDIVDSGLFDRVVIYRDYDAELAAFVKELAPAKIALDFSGSDPLCDGLTMGRYRKFVQSLDGVDFEEISSDRFIPAVRTLNLSDEGTAL